MTDDPFAETIEQIYAEYERAVAELMQFFIAEEPDEARCNAFVFEGCRRLSLTRDRALRRVEEIRRDWSCVR
jgi:hypothetical protein